MKKYTALTLALLTILSIFFCSFAEASTDDFFNDSVFLGDSLTVGLSKYVNSRRKTEANFMGNAIFLARVGYALWHTGQSDGYSMHPEYNGRCLRPDKAIAKINPKRVFIALGVNDVGSSDESILEDYKALIRNVKAAVPKASIYMIALFPMTGRKESSKRSNAIVDALNLKLLNLAMSENIGFIDVTPALKSGNSLNASLSSDDYIHLNNDGYAIWANQMYAFAKFVRKTGSSSAKGSATVINVDSFVNARSGPGTDKSIVTTIPKGETVEVTDSAGSGWYKAVYNGKTVYVNGRYLSTVGSSGLSGTVVNVKTDVNVRKSPSTQASRLGSAKKGASLSVSKSYYSPAWYQVKYGSQTAYISSDYLKLG